MGRARLAGLLCLLGQGAAGAWAQGMYYREVAKDGRVYVFNVSQRYLDWEASGELPGASCGSVSQAVGTGERVARFDSNGWYVQAGRLRNRRTGTTNGELRLQSQFMS